jgi:hypothetical protein
MSSELEYAQQWAVVEDAFNLAIQKSDEFNKKWYDWNFTDPSGKSEILKKMLLQQDFKLNVFTYDDRYHDRCGGSSGSSSYFVTPLSEDEVRTQMRRYYEKRSDDFCCHRFLKHISDFGIYFEDGYSNSCFGGIINNIVDFSGIKEKDLIHPEKYAEIIATREAAETARREKEQREKQEKEKEARRKQFESLKKEFE